MGRGTRGTRGVRPRGPRRAGLPAARPGRISVRMSTDDKRDGEERARAAEHLKQGLGLLFQAAREAATEVKKEIDRGAWAKTLDDAGRELLRATANVVERVGTELKAEVGRVRDSVERPSGGAGADAPPPPPAEAAPREQEPAPEEEEAPPKGGGFRIVMDDEPPKGTDPKGGEPKG